MFLLLCLLVVGPLQAQIAFACEMMDTVFQDDCCCDEPAVDTDCLRADCGATGEAEPTPCCEVSVGISLDHQAQQDTPTLKPPDQQRDVDPPPVLVAAFDDPLLAPQSPAPKVYFFDRAPLPVASDTFLVTRRLRI